MQDLNHRLQLDSLQRFGVQLFADVCLVVRQLQLELKQRLVELSPALSSVNITTAGSGAQQESRELNTLAVTRGRNHTWPRRGTGKAGPTSPTSSNSCSTDTGSVCGRNVSLDTWNLFAALLMRTAPPKPAGRDAQGAEARGGS